MEIFIKELHSFLNHFPDHNEIDTIKIIEKKSEVLSLAIELKNLIHTNMLNIINLLFSGIIDGNMIKIQNYFLNH